MEERLLELLYEYGKYCGDSICIHESDFRDLVGDLMIILNEY